MFVALVASLLMGSTGRLHLASKPDVAIADRWLVLFRADARPALTDALLTEIARRGRVNRRWSSALQGVFVTLSAREALWLSEQPAVEGVFQDVVIDAPWSTPLPDCSVGVAQTPLPSVNPQTITCADPDPQNLAAVCTDNWGLDRLDGSSVMRDGIYAPPRTGAGVHLFIIDTGLYSQHQEFTGRVGAGTDATGSAAGSDDCASWSHGTHVAGIAAGTRFGVAKGAIVHPVRVATCPLNLALSSLVTAFDWIAQQHTTTITGPAVASMSINSALAEFTDVAQPLGIAINGALNAGVLVIESAGNQSADACAWSTNVPGALIVGGSDEFDTPWERRAGDPNFSGWCPPDCGSNVGSCVGVFAPAAHIVSSWFGMTANVQNTCRLSGTSMAAPAVAGAAALYLQQNPTATPAQVKAAIIARARPVLTQTPMGTTNALVTVSEGSADLRLAPATSIDLGSVFLGDASTSQRVTLTSTGTLPLTISAIVVSGLHPADFTVAHQCQTTLAPTATCTLDVTFRPTDTRVRIARVSISSNAGLRSFDLSGFGLEPLVEVTLLGTGSGRVSSMPSGVDCGALCGMTFTQNTNVTLTALATSGSTFAGFSGISGCGAAPTCSFVSLGARRVTAAFELNLAADAGVVDAGRPFDAGMVVDAGATFDAGVVRLDAGQPVAPRVDAGVEPTTVTAVGKCGCTSVPAFLPLLALGLWRRRRP